MGSRDSFAVPGTGFLAGVRVAAGDVTGDGQVEIIVGAGVESEVLVIDPTRFVKDQAGKPHLVPAAVIYDFLAFAGNMPEGILIGACDLTDDGRAALMIGAATGVAEVKVIDPTKLIAPVGKTHPPAEAVLADFEALPTFGTGGVTVASHQGAIITGVGGKVQTWAYQGPNLAQQLLLASLEPYGPAYQGRVYVA